MRIQIDRKLRAVVDLFVSLVLIGLIVSFVNDPPGVGSDTVPSQGQVMTVDLEAYQDEAGTFPIEVINWGELRPGDSVSYQGYVKNTGDFVISLSLEARAWDPEIAGTFIFLSWDRAGYILNLGDLVAFNLSLSVSPEIQDIDSFSLEIWILGLEVV